MGCRWLRMAAAAMALGRQLASAKPWSPRKKENWGPDLGALCCMPGGRVGKPLGGAAGRTVEWLWFGQGCPRMWG